jgi:Domain of unknown function (DUF4194)
MMDPPPISPDPASTARLDVNATVQELLKSGFIGSDRKPALFAKTMRLRNEINAALEPLDLTLKLDEIRGLAILCIAETAANPDDEWNHPLVRRQRLTIEQSLLVAILRQFYVIQEQEAGIGVSEIKIPLEDLLPQLGSFLGDTGSDAKNEQRLLTLLDQLKPHGIVSEADKNHEITIRPLIAHLANPETLTTLLIHFRQLAGKIESAP